MIRVRVSREFPGGWGWKPRKRGKPQGPRQIQHRRIVAELTPDLLRLPRATLVRDICARFQVSRPTAYRVIEFARAA